METHQHECWFVDALAATAETQNWFDRFIAQPARQNHQNKNSLKQFAAAKQTPLNDAPAKTARLFAHARKMRP